MTHGGLPAVCSRMCPRQIVAIESGFVNAIHDRKPQMTLMTFSSMSWSATRHASTRTPTNFAESIRMIPLAEVSGESCGRRNAVARNPRQGCDPAGSGAGCTAYRYRRVALRALPPHLELPPHRQCACTPAHRCDLPRERHRVTPALYPRRTDGGLISWKPGTTQ